jgi:hypothetical protein
MSCCMVRLLLSTVLLVALAGQARGDEPAAPAGAEAAVSQRVTVVDPEDDGPKLKIGQGAGWRLQLTEELFVRAQVALGGPLTRGDDVRCYGGLLTVGWRL